MNHKDKKFDEEALRIKIREQLERKHTEKSKKAENLSTNDLQKIEDDESWYVENHIRRKLQERVYGRRAEFIKCENHLGQIKWLTPLEMEQEYEFFPITATGNGKPCGLVHR